MAIKDNNEPKKNHRNPKESEVFGEKFANFVA